LDASAGQATVVPFTFTTDCAIWQLQTLSFQVVPRQTVAAQFTFTVAQALYQVFVD
jgi:hypothetical protein